MSNLDTHISRYAETFWEKVDRSAGPDKCWLWTGRRDKNDYGLVTATLRASRMALILTIGPLKPGHIARHTCDNPPCCNPAHLLPGTHRQNARDRDRRGRNGKAKVTAEIVSQIRRMYGPDFREKSIAGHFGIPLTTAYNIARRRTWKWVTPANLSPHVK